MRSFLFPLTMVLVCHRLHYHPITLFIQPIFLVRPLIYPANSIQSDKWRRRIRCYGYAAKDHDLGGTMQLSCRHMLTYASNVGGPKGVLEYACILLTKDTVLHGRCQRPTFVSKRATTKEFGRVVRSKS